MSLVPFPLTPSPAEASRSSHELDLALKRIRTGTRITWRNGKYFVLGKDGLSWGGYEDPALALTQYMLCAALADLPPSGNLMVNFGAGKL